MGQGGWRGCKAGWIRREERERKEGVMGVYSH